MPSVFMLGLVLLILTALLAPLARRNLSTPTPHKYRYQVLVSPKTLRMIERHKLYRDWDKRFDAEIVSSEYVDDTNAYLIDTLAVNFLLDSEIEIHFTEKIDLHPRFQYLYRNDVLMSMNLKTTLPPFITSVT